MIHTAIILAAGMGTRLRTHAPSKPLCEVAGRPLIDHALANLAAAGLTRAIVVTGYEAESVEAHLARSSPTRHPSEGWDPSLSRVAPSPDMDGRLRWGDEKRNPAPPLTVETVRTRDWREPNGVSALAAAPLLDGPALLVMCDHLVEPALYARMAASDPGEGLTLGVDRRLGHPWVDPDDVTCVATNGDRIVAIGKHLHPHDCYDTGVFAVGPAFFATLAAIPSPSITDAVRALANEDQARVVDCSDLDWIDVDDAKALAQAEAQLAG